MSNIDNELAFGEYVSLPIRTEKTAEEKWNELRRDIEGRISSLEYFLTFPKHANDLGSHNKLVHLRWFIEKMNDLDT